MHNFVSRDVDGAQNQGELKVKFGENLENGALELKLRVGKVQSVSECGSRRGNMPAKCIPTPGQGEDQVQWLGAWTGSNPGSPRLTSCVILVKLTLIKKCAYFLTIK